MHFIASNVMLCNMYIVISLLVAFFARTSYSIKAARSAYCSRNSQHHYVRDQMDCSVFYVCYRGRAWKMRCSPGTVWSTRYKVCVWDNSAYDDCFPEENSIPSQSPPKQRLLPTGKPKPGPTPTETRPPIRWTRRPIYTRGTKRPPRKKITRPPVTRTTRKPPTTRPPRRFTRKKTTVSPRKTTAPPMFFPWTTRPVTPRWTRRPKTTKRVTTTNHWITKWVPKRPKTTKRSTTTTSTTTTTTTTTTPKPTTTTTVRTRRTTTTARRPPTTPRPRRTTKWWWFTTRKPRRTTRKRRPTTPRKRTRRPRPTRQKIKTTTTTVKPTTQKVRTTTKKLRRPTRKKRPPPIQWRTTRPTTPPTKKTTTPRSIYTKPTWNWWSRRVTKRPTTRITRRTTPRTTTRTTLRTTRLPTTTTTIRTTTLPTTTTTTTTTPPPTTTTTTERITTRRPRRPTTRKPTTKTSPRRTFPPWRYPPDQCGVATSTMIIGGHPSGPGRWPWQVSLQIIAASDPWHRCGGVLVDPLWVLTAAHCVEGPFYGNARNWRVVLSEDDLTRPSGREVFRRISRIVSHPGYMRASNFPNDIALLQLDNPVDVTGRFVRHACLPDREFELGEDWNCWISGWGETRGTSRRYVLNELGVPILDNKNCSNMWSRVGIPVLQTQVCVGNGELGACYGDSGGPLMCEVDGVYVLGGVMSWLINNCTARNFPNVFTRVSSYIDWIYYNMDIYNFRRYS